MKLLTGAIIALVASTAAFAQPGPHGPMGGQGPMAGDMPMMGGMMGGMMGHCAMMGRSEGALAFLKTELAITSAQSKSWDAFAAAYRAEAANKPQGTMMGARGPMMKQRSGAVDGPKVAFPDAMARHIQMIESRVAGAKRLMEAAKPLYDALSAEQRKDADELLMHFVMMRCPMT